MFRLMMPSGCAASLPLTSAVLPVPAGPTNIMGARSSSIMSRKYVNDDVSGVGTNKELIAVTCESNSTSGTRSAHGANLPDLALM